MFVLPLQVTIFHTVAIYKNRAPIKTLKSYLSRKYQASVEILFASNALAYYIKA